MKPSKIHHYQDQLFETRLSDILNPVHELYVLADHINWAEIEEEFNGLFSEKRGAPAKPVRLIVGLLMLEHIFDLSDEEVVSYWVENPYWQLFCGYDFLQWEFPINPSSLSKWRKRLGPNGMEKILAETIKTALNLGAVKKSSLKKVIVDTTVMPKNITYPTDAKLYFTGIKTLVRMAKNHSIELRQTYTFVSKKALRKACSYSHARQMRRANKQRKKLKTYLGRVYRDVARKISGNVIVEAIFQSTLEVIEKILTQEKHSKNKVYSIHEPAVECISKGKAHKKYEFGCKASLVITHKEGLALGTEAVHGNPYDGHTLKSALEKAETLSETVIDQAYVDKGYKGHGIKDKRIFISGQRKGVTRWVKSQIKRRQAIEPHIGHMKSDGKLDRNFLKGVIGDQLNALLCGIGHNMRLVLNFLKVQLNPSFSTG